MLNRFNSQLPKLFLDGSCCVTGQVLCFCAEQATGSGEPQSGMRESLEIVVLMVSWLGAYGCNLLMIANGRPASDTNGQWMAMAYHHIKGVLSSALWWILSCSCIKRVFSLRLFFSNTRVTVVRKGRMKKHDMYQGSRDSTNSQDGNAQANPHRRART